ncbi:MAG: response regulator [Clostridia bacterium]|jgi:two-component system response regulator YesN|nr:response regulator [Clostridia bacterium]
MYKVIIVDDEYYVRKSIIGKIEWDELSLELVGEADNGVMALELLNELDVQIIIMDMRMPEMDGVELVSHIKAKYPDVKTIVISGYQDFEYTKSALKNKVCDYLLKPIDKDALNRSLYDTVQLIADEVLEKGKINTLKIEAELGRVEKCNKFLSRGVNDTSLSEEMIKEGLQKYYPRFVYSHFTVCVFNVERADGVSDDMSWDKVSELFKRIVDKANEKLENKYIVVFKNTLKLSEYVLILGSNNKLDRYLLNDIFINIYFSLIKELKCSAVCGIGSCVQSYKLIQSSYTEACFACSCSGEKLSKPLRFYNDIQEYDAKNIFNQDFYTKLSLLELCVKKGDLKELKAQLHKIFMEIINTSVVSMNYLHAYAIAILIQITKEIMKDEDQTVQNNPNNIINLDQLVAAESLNSVIDFVYEDLIKLIHYHQMQSSGSRSAVYKIKEYIEKNYSEQISLSTLANQLYLNKTYLSRLFKVEAGETLVEYITRVRMKKAMELLKESSVKVLEVANLVGYDDYRHFGKVFKKYYNLTPSDVRNQVLANGLKGEK